MSVPRVLAAVSAAVAVLALAAVPGANLYYSSSRGEGCARCHEIRVNFDSWNHSSHRRVNCTQCHARDEVPERVHLGLDDALQMVARCQSCHRQEFAQWKSGPHSTTYARVFMDPEHNRQRREVLIP